MTTRYRCPECLDAQRCWVCDGVGRHSGTACTTCAGTGTCRACASAPAPALQR